LLRDPTNSLSTGAEQYFSYNQTLNLRQPLLRKPLSDNLTQAPFKVDDAQAGLVREVQNLSVRLVGAYLDHLLSLDQLALVEVQQKLITSQLDAAQKSFAAGSGIRTDVDEAQARLDLNKAQHLEARLQVAMTLRQLEAIVNEPVERLAPMNAQFMLAQPFEERSLNGWIELSEAESPEIKSLQARLEVARLEIAKAQGAHLPTIDAVAQVMRSGSENVLALSSNYTNRVVGLQLNLPLYSGGMINSSVRQAVASFEQAQELLEATRRDLGVRVNREYRGIVEGQLRIKAQEQALVSAEQLVISSQRSFKAGNRTLIDVLNAEQQKQVVVRDLMQARYMYFLAKVKLMALCGLDVTALLSQLSPANP
jgi:outer membrane protein/protease secretion system outer membrane protein